ncbi:MAG: choice-of-anchor D domain-containing protein, partial [Acidimicrobiales bacterium]
MVTAIVGVGSVVGGMVFAVPASAATSLTASPPSVNFPNTAVGSSSAPTTVTITNTAATATTITNVALGGVDPGAFQIENPNDTCLGATLAALTGTCTIPVEFVPLAPGPVTATLDVADPGAGTVLRVLLGGTGQAVPEIAFSPASLGFGAIPVNTVSVNLALEVTNPGGGATTITNVTLTGPNATEFNVVSDGCIGTSLTNPGTPCFLLLNFSPSQGGPATAQLNFSDNAAGSPQVVPLGGTGNGATLALSANPLSFGSVPVGTTSAPVTETLTNTGNVALVINSETAFGPNPTDFVPYQPGSTCSSLPITINAGNSCTIVFAFKPTVAGPESAGRVLGGTFSNSPVSLALQGTGTVTPAIQFSPPSEAFGNVTLGTSTNKTVTVTNVGNGPLVFTPGSVTLGGLNVDQFGVVNDTCSGATLSPAATCKVVVDFAPTIPGSSVANLNFVDNAAGSLQSVPLGGHGSGGFLTATSPLNFPTTPVGATSAPLTLTLGNTGDAPLNVTSSLISGPNTADFTVVPGGTCAAVTPIPIGAGASCTILVVFKPSIAGAETATASLVGNYFNSPVSVTFNGSGAGTPQINFSPPSVAFGNQAVNSTSGSQTVTVTNPGNVPNLVTSVTLGGANPADFNITSNTCNGATLPPASATSCQVKVVFNPQAGGPFTAALLFNDQAAGSPQSVALGGTGTGPGMSVS